MRVNIVGFFVNIVGQPTEMCVFAGRPKDIFGREGEV